MDTKATVAELIGTFTLVFIGASAGVMAAQDGGGGLPTVAFAHGLALMVIIYAFGSISGAHVNPAVTFGVLLGGKMSVQKAISYWVAQFVGAVVAAYLLKWILETVIPGSNLGATVGSLTPNGDKGDAAQRDRGRRRADVFSGGRRHGLGHYGLNGNLAGVAIGLVLTMDILAGGPLTGGSMNPARTFRACAGHRRLELLLDVCCRAACRRRHRGVLFYDRYFMSSEAKPAR